MRRVRHLRAMRAGCAHAAPPAACSASSANTGPTRAAKVAGTSLLGHRKNVAVGRDAALPPVQVHRDIRTVAHGVPPPSGSRADAGGVVAAGCSAHRQPTPGWISWTSSLTAAGSHCRRAPIPSGAPTGTAPGLPRSSGTGPWSAPSRMPAGGPLERHDRADTTRPRAARRAHVGPAGRHAAQPSRRRLEHHRGEPARPLVHPHRGSHPPVVGTEVHLLRRVTCP